MYGMGSMYGGGMGGMYGGMGGMGGMYGGMGSGMYGSGMGGLGMGSSMYGGGMGGSVYGGGMGGSYNSFGNTGMNSYGGGNNYPNGLGNGNPTGGTFDQTQNAALPAGGTGVNLDPSPQSPIQQQAPLPSLSETPAERGRRVRAERHKEQQLIKQQREQRKQMKMQAKMEIAGHLTNVLVQTLRSVMEMFAVCFGTYYSIKAVKAFANGPEQMAARNNVATANQTALVDKAAAAKGAGKGKWKTWLLFGILFMIGEMVYGILTKKSAKPSRRIGRNANAYSLNSEEEFNTSFDSEDSLDWRSEYLLEEEKEEERQKHMYIAMFDYEGGEGEDFISFKAGDKFMVRDYDAAGWCDAMLIQENNADASVRGFVPGNYLRMFEFNTKM